MRRWIVPAIPFAFSLGLSLATVGCHPYWQDSGLYLTAVKELGVLYPPGFVLYEVLCRLWTALLFFVDFTLAVHLFSSLSSSLAAGTMAVAVRDLLRSRGKVFGVLDRDPGPLAEASGIVAGVLLSCGYTFWVSGIYAKGYAFYYLVLSMLIWRMIRADESGRPRDFTLVALLIGLAWQAHPSAALAGAALGAFVAMHARALGTRAVIARVFIAAVTALGPSLVILPILRGRNPWLKMADPDSVGPLVNHILGRRFVAIEGAFGLDGSRVVNFGCYLWEELLGIGLLLLTVGLVTLALKQRRLLIGILLWVIPYSVTTILFKLEGQHDHWFVAAWLPLSLVLGLGACRIGMSAKARALPAVSAVGILGALWAVLANYSSVDQRSYEFAEMYGRVILEPVDRDAVLILYGDDPNSLAGYLQRVRGRRTDVALVTASFLGLRAAGAKDWYDDELLRRHPFLSRPDYSATGRKFPEADLPDAAIAAFLNANLDCGHPLFTDRAAAQTMLRPEAMLVPAGALWKCVRRGPPPPLEQQYWTFPIEPEQLRGRLRRERAQSVERTKDGLVVKPVSYEYRLLSLLLRARVNLGRAIAERGQFEASAQIFDSVLDLEPRLAEDFTVAHFAGLSYNALGRFDRAEPLLRRASEEGNRPDWRATARFVRGQIAQKKGDEAGARRLFQEAVTTPGISDAFRAELEKLIR